MNIRRTDDGEVTGVLTTAAAVQYADEYKFGIDSAGFERFIERYGVMLDREEDIWQNRPFRDPAVCPALLRTELKTAHRNVHDEPQKCQQKQPFCGEDSADIRTAGGVTSLVYEAAEYGEQTRVEAVYTDPEGNTWTQPRKTVRG